MTSQPSGGGQGVQTGTRDSARTASSPSRQGRRGGRRGQTSPCAEQVQALDQTFGGVTGPRHRGQMGAALMVFHGPAVTVATSRFPDSQKMVIWGIYPTREG
ncbi:hypothetical protein GCM10023196_062200 [Actinoallomurus vinaceus]|uniref:Uncharacterized protein n=1 Tax=Actinoallomurus vinaceus TaxID=1080074 RepID=A0ABP8UGW1_9ACTN